MRVEPAGQRDARAAALQPLREIARQLGGVVGNTVTNHQGRPLCWALEVEPASPELAARNIRVVLGGAARHSRAVILLARGDEAFPLMQIAKVLAEFHGDVQRTTLVEWPAGTGLIQDPPSAEYYLLTPTDTFGHLPALPEAMLAVGLSQATSEAVRAKSLNHEALLTRVRQESQDGLALAALGTNH